MADLIKTIENDEDIVNFSDNSDEEEDYQPRKQKKKEHKDFDSGFHFLSDDADYNYDTWNDLNKYITRTAKTKLDDKIKRIRGNNGLHTTDPSHAENKEEVDEEGDPYIFNDDFRKDIFKTKTSKGKKKFLKQPEMMEFEECAPVDVYASFYQMNLSRPLLKAIGTMNFISPTPIQAATVPVALMGRDICGCAATGTGKTAAYMLPTLERLLYRPRDGPAVTRVLILVPTRELGIQVYQVSKQLSQYTTIEIGLSIGGLDLKIQEAILRKNPDIVIATPGRLIDHLTNTPTFSLNSIEILILDEADKMLDEYFAEQMKHIVKQCARTRQTILFSATMTEEVNDLAAVSLDKPVKVFVGSNQDVAFNLRQEFVRIRREREGDREAILAALICRTFHNNVMVFVQTKKQVHRLHILIGLLGIKVGELHGNLSQPQRLENLRKFKEEEIDVLLATDVAARGLDISGVKTVINFVMPATIQHYIHRVGRTARAGKAGVSVSLVGEHERGLVKSVIRHANNPVKNRIIASDIVEKYCERLKELEKSVEKILEEETIERELAKVENQAKKAERSLKNKNQETRGWFQCCREKNFAKKGSRLVEFTRKKERNLVQESKRQTRRKTKEDVNSVEERANKELDKVAEIQARAAKKSGKLKKIRTVIENGGMRQYNGPKKRAKSSFASDLTDIGRKGVKRLRYEANKKQKQKFKKRPKNQT
ncbi:probable ATP-dependent RNA helicase DDX27 [Fopius arisanus]|uniref:RNA helicase n=1 Tax=Fopius arisanus TaxID=64838 RepID=A0A0C9QFC5_9HYME|nr:PREDICTED: probable ATP-dependent RNA helicase DDX27 [Fopius arisanus]